MKRSLLAVLVLALGGCAAAGNLAKSVGDGLQNFGASRQDSFIGRAATTAGGVHKSAGEAVNPSTSSTPSTDAVKKKEK